MSKQGDTVIMLATLPNTNNLIQFFHRKIWQ